VDATTSIATIKSLGFDNYASVQGVEEPTRKQLTVEVVRAVKLEALKCLEAINRAANGEVPSEVIGQGPNPSVLTDAAYWVALLITSGQLSLSRIRFVDKNAMPELQDALIDATTTLSYAWAQVLAGDMDDICEGLTEEMS
jgi:hypothetical protein